MTEWKDFDVSFNITTEQTLGTAVNVYSQSQAIGDRTVVDGYVTIITDTDNLCQVRMWAPAPGFTAAGDFSFASPVRREAINWYWFNCGRGPMVFRLRSKRTFAQSQEWWMACAKLRGADATNVEVGIQYLLSP